MKLSVIISSYKFKDYIKQCVDSVLSQKMDFSFEVLIRDDGTNDGTYEMLCETYGSNPNVKILDSSTNVGAIKNLLLLMNDVSGKYVAHIDGDDYFIDNEHFQRAVKFLDENPTYAVYSSGCKYMENDKITPENYWVVSAKPDFQLSDMLIENYVSFGRVFRKANIPESIFSGIPYPDWVFNFEILKHGRGYCDTKYCVGLYRIHEGGMFSMTTNDQKLDNKRIIQKELTKRYSIFQHKVITIVDSFVYNDAIRKKLSDALDWMKEDGHDVLLVSNTSVDKEILSKVKFYLYDHRNQLFSEKYEQGANLVDFWKVFNDWFEMHDIVPVLQKHGLSVLVNLFNALIYAKAQGYTHFQRFEVDDLFGKKSREYIKNVPEMCASENKKGLFYYNEEDSQPDISFHYFYCEIDSFLSKVPRISCEQDYVEYLKKYHNNKEFRIVEVFVYDNLKRNGDSEFITKLGEKNMYVDLCDTHWNTETSVSSFDSKYGKCTTKLYYVNEYNKETNLYKRGNTYILLTYSYHSVKTNRKIKLLKNNGEEFYIHHETSGAGGWMWNEVPGDTKSMSVYENEKLLYTEYASDCISYVNLKR
jgi:glycosyltransferase involved in cell wall biosynthesis